MYPYIFVLGIQIPTYGICLAMAFVAVTLGSILRAKKKKIVPEDILIVAASVLGCAICGAKILYIMVSYTWYEIITFIRMGNYEFLLGDGLVFAGGLLCGLLGAVIGAKIAGTKLYYLENAIVPLLPIGYAIGRIGCFFAGCCYGMIYAGPGAVHYKNSLLGLSPDVGYFPVQLVDALINVGVTMRLLYSAKKGREHYELLVEYLSLYAVSRFFLEYLRGDYHRGIYGFFSTSQWICIILLLVCIVWKVCRKNKNPKPVL